MQIQNVKAHSSVGKTTVQISVPHTAAQRLAAGTRIVLTKNAILMRINVVSIPIALIGHFALRNRHATMARVIVMLTLIVKVHLYAVVTTVLMEQQSWIVVISITTVIIIFT